MADKVHRDRRYLSLLGAEDLLEVLHLLFLVEVGQLVVGLLIALQVVVYVIMEFLTADSWDELHILLEQSHSVVVNSTYIRVFEE